MPITKAESRSESKAAVTNVINIGQPRTREAPVGPQVTYPPESTLAKRGEALACEHAALIYVNRVRRRGEAFSEDDIREIIRFLTAADSVQLIVDTQPGCFKSETKIKAAYVDKDGKRTNFIEMIDAYKFFTDELGFSF